MYASFSFFIEIKKDKGRIEFLKCWFSPFHKEIKNVKNHALQNGAGTRQSSCIVISFVLWVYERFMNQNDLVTNAVMYFMWDIFAKQSRSLDGKYLFHNAY